MQGQIPKIKKNVMETLVKNLIDTTDFDGLKQVLSQNPNLANEGIPFANVNTTKAHPLHRICDGVFLNIYSDEDAVKMAKIFLEFGADINGGKLIKKQDTPLIAASSLYADLVALLYIDRGAEINHPGCHGGTVLHWAAWCGRPKVVEKLIHAHADINKECIDYQGTPLSWAIHSLKERDKKELHSHFECIKMLLKAGADKNISNDDRQAIFDLLRNEDSELKELLP